MVENQRVSLRLYTPVNIAGWKILKMYFLLKMVIFQPAMLVYQRVDLTYKGPHVTPNYRQQSCLPPLRWRTWTPRRQRHPHWNRRWVTRRRSFQGHGGQQWRGHSGNELLKPWNQSGGSLKDRKTFHFPPGPVNIIGLPKLGPQNM